MKRREFIAFVGGLAVARPFTALAQTTDKLPVIGFLGASTKSLQAQWTAAFVQRLRELGWIEGRTVVIEFRWGEGQSARYAESIVEFLRLKVDVIVTHGEAAPLTAKRATSVIPIVFPVAANPVENGIVDSLSQPGGNLTGLSLQRADTTAKRIEILREVAPALRRLGILAHSGTPAGVAEANDAQATAQKLVLDVVKSEIEQAKDIPVAFGTFKGRVDALYVAAGPLINVNRGLINKLALAASLPTIYGVREFVDAGGLISYGPDFADLFRRSADLVDKILRGAKPADIPVEQPTKFDLVINLKTAKTLRLSIPQTPLATADEVVE